MAAADGILMGMRGLFDSLGKAGMARDEAQMTAGLRTAQAYNANMHGNKAGAEAEGLGMTNGYRKGLVNGTQDTTGLPAQLQPIAKLFGLTGETNLKSMAEAGGALQTQGIQQKALESVGDIDMMNRLNTLTKEGATYEPMRAAGNTGVAVNQATGAGTVFDQTLNKLFNAKTGSEIQENRASAGASGASAGLSNERKKEIQMGKVQNALDADGNPILFRAGTNGKTTVMEDLAPFSKSGGADAAATKLRGQIARDVQKDASIYPEEQEAEIDRRLALAVKGGKPAAKGAAAAHATPKMDANTQNAAEKIRTAFKEGKLSREEAKKQLQSLGYN